MILRLWHKVAPVLSMVVALIVLWYGAAIWLNTHWAEDKAQRAGVTLTITALIADTWSQEKPKLPAPHQVAHEIWKTTVLKKITSKRSLIHHSKSYPQFDVIGLCAWHCAWDRAGGWDCL